MCAYINVATLCVFNWIKMRCNILGYKGAIHLVKLHSSINVGYGMQCAWVTEDGDGGVTANSKLLVGQMMK